ncbi:hypothetical protein BDN72DRAFT_809741 [Pluteus cervinus]|uniref:Uncharacterized protein n=1 Tax=Pluteus cervinus TaxID=181527 RepID=A0ACD3BDY2_9AGAR|nr:hypothetical protein BDN72DRAFT_809741 [Pluteus cervinus]
MRLEALLPRQSSSANCIACPDPIPCSCTADQVCFQINRDCFSCSSTKCVPKQNPTAKKSGGASKGALAGGLIGAFIILGLAVGLLLWYRRNNRFKSTRTEAKPDVPAPASDVLNRPDPTEKAAAELNNVRMYTSSNHTTLDLEQAPQNPSIHPARYSQSTNGTNPTNPFDDRHSIQTAITEGTNVIPIALVPPESHRVSTDAETVPSTTSSAPIRPARSPDLNLNLEHVNVSRETLHYAASQISGISARNSYMSGASYSSDFLNEAPMIVTPTRGAVRQVLGVVKAEVISAPPSPMTADGLKPPTAASSRPSVTSPLAATSFGPADVVHEVDEGQEVANPFSDAHSSHVASPSPSVTTFGQLTPARSQHDLDPNWQPENPNLPWSNDDLSRPTSMTTQAGSVADIGNVTRINLGLSQINTPTPPSHLPPSPNINRYTTGHLIASNAGSGTLEQQQQQALAHAQAQTNDGRRISGSSVLSAASTRADSILESFPFVPPSPISDRPARSPPVSPLAQQSFTGSPTPLAKKVVTRNAAGSGRPPIVIDSSPAREIKHSGDDVLPAPPNRRTLGLSTGSQLSTVSTGLGSFPFHIDPGTTSEVPGPPSSTYAGRQRASLDTLALTSDLSSYPLEFNRDSVPAPKRS